MPTTPMHEDGLTLSNNCQIRFPRQITRAATVFNSHSPHNATHDDLGSRAAGLNPAHYFTALAGTKCIHVRMPNVGQTSSRCYHFGNLSFQSSDLNRTIRQISQFRFYEVLNCSSISTWYPAARRLVSLAMPTTAMSSWNMASVMPLLRAEAVCEAMQYGHWFVTLTAM